MSRTLQKLEAICNIARTMESLSSSDIRKVGCVVSSDDFMYIGVGYNGPHAGAVSEKPIKDESSGELHAEVNALMKSPPMYRAFMVVTCPPCMACAGYIINARIRHVIIAVPHVTPFVASRDGVERLERGGAVVVYEQELHEHPIDKLFIGSVAGVTPPALLRNELEQKREYEL